MTAHIGILKRQEARAWESSRISVFFRTLWCLQKGYCHTLNHTQPSGLWELVDGHSVFVLQLYTITHVRCFRCPHSSRDPDFVPFSASLLDWQSLVRSPKIRTWSCSIKGTKFLLAHVPGYWDSSSQYYYRCLTLVLPNTTLNHCAYAWLISSNCVSKNF